jgi:alkylation response protein AidB-like acyl-CoA dehydrogenase
MADFGVSDLELFRREVREWVEANAPASIRGTGNAMGPGAQLEKSDDMERWRIALADKGWTAPTWPKEYGGAALSIPQGRVIEQELARAKLPNPAQGMGMIMFAPTLLEFGTHEQKLRHLPPIARGEKRWCQGYSEPGSGSDLASLQTRCEDKGDHYLINGQKIWTSGAHLADWCFCLVRTDTTKKHEGISFVLIDMHQPGVLARPIRLIDDSTPFCETFFTDARAEKNNLVGPWNGGWTVGKRLLQFERSGGGGAGVDPWPSLGELAKRYLPVDEDGRLSDADLRTRITESAMEQNAVRLTFARQAEEAKAQLNVSAMTSVMKNAVTRANQVREELMVEIMGHQGLGWEGDEFSDLETSVVRRWLADKASTIYSGSFEIQYNIISKRILGLPDAGRAT